MTESLKILLVDDEEDSLLAMEDFLEEMGAEVYKASSGLEALVLVKQHDFAAVVLDVVMLGMDGFEVAKRIRDLRKKDHPPIIFLTGQTTDQDFVFLGYESGGVDYLFKPVDPRILKSKVKVFLELKSAQLSLKRSNEALRESEGHKKAILSSVLDCIFNIDQEGRILESNPAAERTLGYPLSQMQGKVLSDLMIVPAFRDQYLRALSDCHQKEKGILLGRRLDVEAIDASGRKFPVELAITRTPLGGPPLFNVFMHDISERKQIEHVFKNQAIHDSLTGLYNRRYFDDQAPQAIARSIRNDRPMALLFCDLDRFKLINDQKGHHVGDQTLKSVAENMQLSVRETDFVFRWGGDEFVVILADVTREGILMTFKRIEEGLVETRHQIDFPLDLSVGVAVCPDHGTDLNGLTRVADLALYRAKRGREKICFGGK